MTSVPEPTLQKLDLQNQRSPEAAKNPMAEEADEAPKVQRGGSCGKVVFPMMDPWDWYIYHEPPKMNRGNS